MIILLTMRLDLYFFEKSDFRPQSYSSGNSGYFCISVACSNNINLPNLSILRCTLEVLGCNHSLLEFSNTFASQSHPPSFTISELMLLGYTLQILGCDSTCLKFSTTFASQSWPPTLTFSEFVDFDTHSTKSGKKPYTSRFFNYFL